MRHLHWLGDRCRSGLEILSEHAHSVIDKVVEKQLIAYRL